MCQADDCHHVLGRVKEFSKASWLLSQLSLPL